MKSRALAASRCHTRTPAALDSQTVITPRYEAARAALDACWSQRPRVFTPERERFERGELKDARAEVRAAWLEAAALHGINPDVPY